MTPTVDDYKLLQKLNDVGGSIHLEGNVDHRPYMRLEQLAWATSRNLNMQEAVYTITAAGTLALREV
ncbi:hypothetical protein ABIA85_006647 [Bradyrhizobium sp. LA6.10]|uniref:hypothetical protein n=1 Tax=Bradyrhizobium sp. LA6.10 TaxID=3156318 RepID=UPI0033968A10